MALPQSQPVTLASPRADGPLPPRASALGGPEAQELKHQVRHHQLQGLREYLARTRKEGDWQDRLFMLPLIVPDIDAGTLDKACEKEPGAADLFLIRCAFYSELASTMRGAGTSDQVTRERFQNSGECIQFALAALEKTCQLDPQDPTAYSCLLPVLSIFGRYAPLQQRVFEKAIEVAPDLVPVYRTMVRALSKRWGGSHEESLKMARTGMSKAGPGSDMAACLFWAHILVRTHYSAFDENLAAEKRYAHHPAVVQELNAAFDAWIKPPYTPRRSSIPYLHYPAWWFYYGGDRARLNQALSLINNVFSDMPWAMMGNGLTKYAQAVQYAAQTDSPKKEKQSLLARILGRVGHI